ncbi:MAG: PIG-L family deacetylase [Halioglobus sp.]
MRIYLLAHQDDEFALLQSIRESQASGAAIVYTTNGLQPGVEPITRNNESLKVLAAIGVTPSDVHFLGGEYGFNDGSLHQHLPEAWNALLALTERLGDTITSVYMPAWEAGHQDHDVTHALGICLARHFGCLENSRQISLYHGYGLPWKLYRVQSPLPANGQLFPLSIPWKARLVFLGLFRHYRSQWLTWLALYPYVFFHLVTRGKELLQPISVARLSEKPHPGKALYEKRQVCEEAKILQSIRQFLSTLG